MSSSPASNGYLVRIPDGFQDLTADLLQHLGATSSTRLGQEYHWIQAPHLTSLRDSPVALFLHWNIPVHHAWPCNPQKMEGFIEKAAQAMARKFAPLNPQTVLVGLLYPGPANHYYRQLASNLRGRALQIFPAPSVPLREAEAQNPTAPTLYCLVGREGLFCGMQSPRDSNGFHPGGTRYVSQDSSTISRAGAKIAEALHYLRLYRPPLAEGSHWLELGASPGGMTAELLDRQFRVTAVDRAPLDRRLANEARLAFSMSDVAEFQPPAGSRYDAILSDLNGEAKESIQHVIRLAPSLRPGGLVVFTLKLPGVETVSRVLALKNSVVHTASSAGLKPLAETHLSYNRHEFTLFFEKSE